MRPGRPAGSATGRRARPIATVRRTPPPHEARPALAASAAARLHAHTHARPAHRLARRPSPPRRYGLLATEPGAFPHAELADFKAWRTQPLNMLRTQPVAACAEPTFDRQDKKLASVYLGFVHAFCQADMHASRLTWPSSLLHYLQPKLFLRFLGSLLTKGCSPAYVKSHVAMACRVLEWARASQQGSHASDAQRAFLDAWERGLGLFRRQCEKLPRRRPAESVGDLAERGAWLPYVQLYKVTHAAVARLTATLHALFRCQLEPEEWEQLREGAATMDAELARSSHDTALLALMIGYVPPMRASTVISLKHPDHARERCALGSRCPYGQACCGNRLEYIVQHNAPSTVDRCAPDPTRPTNSPNRSQGMCNSRGGTPHQHTHAQQYT